VAVVGAAFDNSIVGRLTFAADPDRQSIIYFGLPGRLVDITLTIRTVAGTTPRFGVAVGNSRDDSLLRFGFTDVAPVSNAIGRRVVGTRPDVDLEVYPGTHLVVEARDFNTGVVDVYGGVITGEAT